MTDTVTTIRQAIQDFVAPEIKEIRVDIKALEVKIESMHTDMHGFRGEILGAIQDATLRGDLETTRQPADIRERVTRLEERQARQ